MKTQHKSAGIISSAIIAALLPLPALAFSIELKGASPQRIEQQRAYTLKPAEKANVAPARKKIAARLDELGVKRGTGALIRIFKAESRLELWLRKGRTFVLYKTFPVCFWSGKLGPKQNEGDGQTPEGLYALTRSQLHWSARWARSLNIGYPNALDRRHGRTGSHILIHGGCSSIGCFSMTNRVMSEIHHLVKAALKRRQAVVHVHIFPFRLTDENLARHAESPWLGFWRQMQPAFTHFEKTRRPPRIAICGKRYLIKPAAARGALSRPIAVLDGRSRTSRALRRHWKCTPPAHATTARGTQKQSRSARTQL